MSGEGKGPIHSLRAGHEQYASVAVCEITPRLSIGTQWGILAEISKLGKWPTLWAHTATGTHPHLELHRTAELGKERCNYSHFMMSKQFQRGSVTCLRPQEGLGLKFCQSSSRDWTSAINAVCWCLWQRLHTRAALPGGSGVPASLQEPAALHSRTQPSAACSTDVWGWAILCGLGAFCALEEA